MYFRIFIYLLCLTTVASIMGCHIILAEQEWSDNFALLDGVVSTSPEMIDGNMETVGKTADIDSAAVNYGSAWGTAVSIKLPEKKHIRKIVIHTENVQKLNLYADKGGTMLSDTDWVLLKEIKGVSSNPIVIPLSANFPIDNLRIVVLDTTDDAALNRRRNAEIMREEERRERSGERDPGGLSNNRGGRRGNRQRVPYPGRINEIELYGYKSAEETAAGKPNKQREEELDTLLEME